MSAHLKWQDMGTQLEVIVGPSSTGADPQKAAKEIQELWQRFNQVGSRFKPDSELERVNRDRRSEIEVSPLLAEMIACALEAAEKSGGLIDPTLAPQLREAGYAESWNNKRTISLKQALLEAPDNQPAQSAKHPAWRNIKLNGTKLERPVGTEIEIGASGKGLAADLAARKLSQNFDWWTVNCGGDLRSGGSLGLSQTVEISSPLEQSITGELLLDGGLATSGISRRIWRNPDGKIAHHLLNPRDGKPVWSGLIQVSAAAPSAAQAERLAGQSMLSGKQEARRLLSRYGGMIIDRDGQVEQIEGRPQISARKLKQVYA